jgi:hypothetical protein
MSCSWPVDRTCLPVADTEIDAQQQQDAEDLAVAVLWSLSGRQFGVCPVIARPCRQPCGGAAYLGVDPYSSTIEPWFPVWDGTNWRNVACGCGPKCSWVAPNVVHLVSAGQPVQEVTEVVIAGEVLDESEYRLEGDLLYRIGADWPTQDLTQPLDQPGTWSVTYTRGNPPPPGTAKLVGLLAAEFLAACSGGKCRLPRRVQTVTRQGVSYTMTDPTDIYASGKTGIPEIDLWLSAVNPNKLSAAPVVR